MIDHPKVTVTDISAKIMAVDYLYHKQLTICILTLENGFTVTGESACVSEENYNKALGEKYAYEAAFDRCWQIEGYLLREKLFRQALANGA